MEFFTADEHYFHKNIILPEYANRPYPDIWTMNEDLIFRHNEVVGPKDTVYHGGDFALCSINKVRKIISRLNGNHVFIQGSHDREIARLGKRGEIDYRGRRVEITIKNRFIVIDHYCLRVWARSHYNSWHLYGHCLDLQTEILTDNGWKFRDQLLAYDKILSFNIETGLLEYNNINEIIDSSYTGNIYSLKSRGIDLRVTSKHVLIDITRRKKNNIVQKFYAEDLNKIERRLFIKSGFLEKNPADISDNHIRLLVWISADGSLANSNLGRLRVSKERKMERIKWLLSQLNIEYSDNAQKDASVCYNFQIPKALSKCRFKPLDKIVLNFNRSQVEVMLDEYSRTDGYKNGNSILIYTSKKEEVDIIQTACITNGFTCNYSRRIGHRFSKKPSYELAVTDSTTRIHSKLQDKVIVEPVIDEPTWCVKVKNKTIFVRRNGKPLLVGNSHGRLKPIGKSWDIGVDNNDFYPLSFDRICEIMAERPDNPNLIKKER